MQNGFLFFKKNSLNFCVVDAVHKMGCSFKIVHVCVFHTWQLCVCCLENWELKSIRLQVAKFENTGLHDIQQSLVKHTISSTVLPQDPISLAPSKQSCLKKLCFKRSYLQSDKTHWVVQCHRSHRPAQLCSWIKRKISVLSCLERIPKCRYLGLLS